MSCFPVTITRSVGVASSSCAELIKASLSVYLDRVGFCTIDFELSTLESYPLSGQISVSDTISPVLNVKALVQELVSIVFVQLVQVNPSKEIDIDVVALASYTSRIPDWMIPSSIEVHPIASTDKTISLVASVTVAVKSPCIVEYVLFPHPTHAEPVTDPPVSSFPLISV